MWMDKCLNIEMRKLTGHDVTSSERIASVSLGAAAYWIVIDYLTFGILSTSSWTGILTLVRETRLS